MRLRQLPKTRIVIAGLTCLGALISGCKRDVPMQDAPHPRVVTLSPALTTLMFQMGLGDHVVGVTNLCVLPEGSAPRRVVGDRLSSGQNPEAIATVDPDFVLIQQDIRDFASLKQIKPKVQVEHFQIETLAHIGEAMERLGRIVNKPEVGRDFRSKFDSQLRGIREKYAGVARPRVLFVMTYGDQDSAAGPGSFMQEMIEIAGGTNAVTTSGRWQSQNAESILAMAPDHVVVLTSAQEAQAARKHWIDLRVSPERIHIVTDNNWTIPTMRLADLTESLGQMIHPELSAGSSKAGR